MCVCLCTYTSPWVILVCGNCVMWSEWGYKIVHSKAFCGCVWRHLRSGILTLLMNFTRNWMVLFCNNTSNLVMVTRSKFRCQLQHLESIKCSFNVIVLPSLFVVRVSVITHVVNLLHYCNSIVHVHVFVIARS